MHSLSAVPVQCVEVDRDRYARAVAVCTVAGVDLAEWLVKNGLALDWPRYSQGAYAIVQSEAKQKNIGLWGGRFNEPGAIVNAGNNLERQLIALIQADCKVRK